MEKYQELEKKFGDWIGIQDVVACSSGTAALCLAIETLRLPSQSLCLIPDYTMIACARAVSLSGHIPVLVDCDENLLLDTQVMHDVCNRLPIKLIMAVHIYGRPCYMDAIHEAGSKYGCRVLEDMAEAHNTLPHYLTDAACYSFYKNKIIHGEEGGAVAFNQRDGVARAAVARSLRSLGFTDNHDYTHIPGGHNYRMSNLHAKCILDNSAGMSRDYLKAVMDKRFAIAAEYDYHCPERWQMPSRESNWVYDIRIPYLSLVQQSEIVKRLQAERIEARHGFKPISSQKEYEKCKRASKLGIGESNASRASREVIYFPIMPGITTKNSVKRCFEVCEQVITGS